MSDEFDFVNYCINQLNPIVVQRVNYKYVNNGLAYHNWDHIVQMYKDL